MSLKCGMGTGRYKFDKGGVKTATEVISDKDDLYQNLQKHKLQVSAALMGMVKALYFLEHGAGEIEVKIDLDDSIIEDSNAIVDKNIKLVQAGLRSKLSAIMEVNSCSEADAQKELKQIAEENQITGQDIDWTEKDADDEEEEEGKAKKIGFQRPEKDGGEDESSGKPKGG